MNKKLRSLSAAFALAVAGTLGVTSAQAQTVPVYNAPTVQTSATYTAGYVTQSAIDQVAYDLGVQDSYHRAGRGFTSGLITPTGQHVGLEFTLHGDGYASVSRAYNLNNPAVMQSFQNRIAETARLENQLARGTTYPHRSYNAPVYRAPNATEVIAAVGFAIIVHEALKDNDHHRRDDRHWRNDHRRNDRHHREWNRNRHHRPHR
jgi:hypothetical protein